MATISREVELEFLDEGGGAEFVTCGRVVEVVRGYLAENRLDEAVALLVTSPADVGDVLIAELQDGSRALRGRLADSFFRARDFDRAARCALALGDHARAAGYLEANYELGRAAALWVQAAEPARAAGLYERSGELTRAAALYAEVEDFLRAAECLERAGELYAAGQLYLRVRRTERAAELLQRLEPGHVDFVPATRLLGMIFERTGNVELAMARYIQLVKCLACDADTLEIYLRLAHQYAERGFDKPAALLCRKVLQLDPRNRAASELLEQTGAVAEPAPPTAPPPPLAAGPTGGWPAVAPQAAARSERASSGDPDANDARSDRAHADGARSDGAPANGDRSDGAPANGGRSDGAHTNGARSDRAQASGGRPDGLRLAAPVAAEPSGPLPSPGRPAAAAASSLGRIALKSRAATPEELRAREEARLARDEAARSAPPRREPPPPPRTEPLPPSREEPAPPSETAAPPPERPRRVSGEMPAVAPGGSSPAQRAVTLRLDLKLMWSLPLFADLSAEELRLLAEIFDRVELPPHATIIEQGLPGDALFVLVKGRVRIVTIEPAEGERSVERALGELGPGSALGEMALVDEAPTSARVTTLTEVTLLRAPMERLRRHLAAHERTSLRIYRVLARTLSGRLRSANSR